MPVTWLLTLDGMMTIVGVLITFPVWRWLAKRGREPDTMQKFIVTSVLITLAYTILAMGAGVAAPAGRLVPLAVVVLFFITLDVSFGWLDPPGNAFVSRFAPPRLVTTLMSINLMLVSGVPNIIVGWLGRFYEPLGPTAFRWLHAAIAAGGGMAALLLRPLIAHLLDDREGTAMLPAPA